MKLLLTTLSQALPPLLTGGLFGLAIFAGLAGMPCLSTLAILFGITSALVFLLSELDNKPPQCKSNHKNNDL